MGMRSANSTTNMCYFINVQCFILLGKGVCQLKIVSIYLARFLGASVSDPTGALSLYLAGGGRSP